MSEQSFSNPDDSTYRELNQRAGSCSLAELSDVAGQIASRLLTEESSVNAPPEGQAYIPLPRVVERLTTIEPRALPDVTRLVGNTLLRLAKTESSSPEARHESMYYQLFAQLSEARSEATRKATMPDRRVRQSARIRTDAATDALIARLTEGIRLVHEERGSTSSSTFFRLRQFESQMRSTYQKLNRNRCPILSQSDMKERIAVLAETVATLQSDAVIGDKARVAKQLRSIGKNSPEVLSKAVIAILSDTSQDRVILDGHVAACQSFRNLSNLVKSDDTTLRHILNLAEDDRLSWQVSSRTAEALRPFVTGEQCSFEYILHATRSIFERTLLGPGLYIALRSDAEYVLGDGKAYPRVSNRMLLAGAWFLLRQRR